MELLADLLYEMAEVLDYDFDKVHLKRGAYIPKGHTDIEVEQTFIRKSLAELLLGKRSMAINIVKSGEELQKGTNETKEKDKSKEQQLKLAGAVKRATGFLPYSPFLSAIVNLPFFSNAHFVGEIRTPHVPHESAYSFDKSAIELCLTHLPNPRYPLARIDEKNWIGRRYFSS